MVFLTRTVTGEFPHSVPWANRYNRDGKYRYTRQLIHRRRPPNGTCLCDGAAPEAMRSTQAGCRPRQRQALLRWTCDSRLTWKKGLARTSRNISPIFQMTPSAEQPEHVGAVDFRSRPKMEEYIEWRPNAATLVGSTSVVPDGPAHGPYSPETTQNFGRCAKQREIPWALCPGVLTSAPKFIMGGSYMLRRSALVWALFPAFLLAASSGRTAPIGDAELRTATRTPATG